MMIKHIEIMQRVKTRSAYQWLSIAKRLNNKRSGKLITLYEYCDAYGFPYYDMKESFLASRPAIFYLSDMRKILGKPPNTCEYHMNNIRVLRNDERLELRAKGKMHQAITMQEAAIFFNCEIVPFIEALECKKYRYPLNTTRSKK